MRLREDLKLRKIGKDFIIVEPEKNMVDFSKVYSLNETAAWLWEELAEKDFTYEDVFAMFEEHYEIEGQDVDSMKEDVKILIDSFETNGLLKIK